MATIKLCDFCNVHPKEYGATSGGNVVMVEIMITRGSTLSTDDRIYRADMCETCRQRVLGEFTRNIGPNNGFIAPMVESERTKDDLWEHLNA